MGFIRISNEPILHRFLFFISFETPISFYVSYFKANINEAESRMSGLNLSMLLLSKADYNLEEKSFKYYLCGLWANFNQMSLTLHTWLYYGVLYLTLTSTVDYYEVSSD